VRDIVIRSEKTEDYSRIAELQFLAFANEEFIGESVLIDVLRHRGQFDPELSLVAIKSNKIIGHILFNPFTLYHGQKEIPAVNLAPLSVDPDYQKIGIGRRLVEAGHEIACKKGYYISFLWGHASYYPRFGYIKSAFAGGGIKVPQKKITFEDDISLSNNNLEAQIPRQKDIPYLVELWKKNFMDTGLSIFPGSSITDWVSYTSSVKTSLIKINGENKGYLRYKKGSENKPMFFLGEDAASLIEMIAYLQGELEGEKDNYEFILPLHPKNNIVKKIQDNIPYQPYLQTVDPFMICPLKGDISDDLIDKKNPGLFVLPPHFDIA
jgi:predicted N-acetyltransferase YhbS